MNLLLTKSLLNLALLAFCLGIASKAQAAEDGWEAIGVDNGVEVFRKRIEGSPLVGFKGIKVMDIPITQVAAVLLDRDPETQKKWIDRIDQFIVLKEAAYSSITYSSYKLPWPIANRDYVIVSQLQIDNENHRVLIELRSTEHDAAPPTVGIRAELVNSRYILVPLPNGQTQVSVEILTDPKGRLPVWLVNLIQKGWPAQSLSNLEELAGQADTGHHPLILKELEILQRYSLK